MSTQKVRRFPPMSPQRELDCLVADAIEDGVKTLTNWMDGAPVGLRHYCTDEAECCRAEDVVKRCGKWSAYLQVLDGVAVATLEQRCKAIVEVML